MAQPPVPGRDAGPEPGPDPRLPGGPAEPRRSGRKLQLSDFTKGSAGDTCPPDLDLTAALDLLSGPDRRCAGATDDELAGLLGRWAAVESWAAAAKLGVIRELIRRRAKPGHENRAPGELPTAWEEGLGHELALALAASLPGADKLAALAWELQARLPGIAAKLADGTIDAVKARLVADALSILGDEAAAQAEALILDELAGKTPGQIARLAAAAAVSVDPKGAEKRREQAERDNARVRFWREAAGTAALAGFGLPTDAALAANANINARAKAYKKAKLDGTMDQLRVLAFLDICNGITADVRIAQTRADAQADAVDADSQARCPGGDPDTDSTGDGESGGTGSGGGPGRGDGPDRSGGAPSAPSAPGGGDAGPELAASINLTVPLANVQGLADRPGHGHGLGPLDPALARDLAAAAARSPHSTFCVTVTSPEGYAIGHGCARPAKRTRERGKSPPARNRDGPWSFTRADDPGPPGGYGTWTLTLPDGREFTVRLGPIPVTDCDHRYESRGYQPGGTLRHLVQVRDGTCTFPACSRHARESDFEHALPYDQGGRTCGCNAGARSRRCHKVKQSKGWSVTQPLPGWHQWRTPSGRTYTQGPAKYPA